MKRGEEEIQDLILHVWYQISLVFVLDGESCFVKQKISVIHVFLIRRLQDVYDFFKT